MDNLIKTRTYSEKARSYLKTGYTMLASFVPDKEVKLVKAGEKALAASVRKQAEARGETGGDDDDWDSVNKSSTILTKIRQEMYQRQEDINKYELQQLLAHAAGQ